MQARAAGLDQAPRAGPARERHSSDRQTRVWLAVTIAWAAGFVDVTAYLVLLNVFVAQQSGNTVRFSLYLARGEWTLALRHGLPIALFVLSVSVGSVLAEFARRRGARTVATLLSIEVALLIAMLVIGLHMLVVPASMLAGWQFYLLVGLATGSMGLQTAALQQVGGQTVRTTYVTGMLTNLAVGIARFLVAAYDRARHRRHARAPESDRFILLAGIWSGYAAGGGCGVLVYDRWGLRDLIAPLCVLSLAAAVDTVLHPHRDTAGTFTTR